jgi:hypothetical protein
LVLLNDDLLCVVTALGKRLACISRHNGALLFVAY